MICLIDSPIGLLLVVTPLPLAFVFSLTTSMPLYDEPDLSAQVTLSK